MNWVLDDTVELNFIYSQPESKDPAHYPKMVGNTRSDECVCEVTLGLGPRSITVRVPVAIPCNICPVELAHRLVLHHNIPVYLHSGELDAVTNQHADSLSDSKQLLCHAKEYHE